MQDVFMTQPFKPAKPKCPACNTAKHVDVIGARCFCNQCKGTFEPDDEGGDFSDRNPAARLEREERRQQNQSHRNHR